MGSLAVAGVWLGAARGVGGNWHQPIGEEEGEGGNYMTCFTPSIHHQSSFSLTIFVPRWFGAHLSQEAGHFALPACLRLQRFWFFLSFLLLYVFMCLICLLRAFPKCNPMFQVSLPGFRDFILEMVTTLAAVTCLLCLLTLTPLVVGADLTFAR